MSKNTLYAFNTITIVMTMIWITGCQLSPSTTVEVEPTTTVPRFTFPTMPSSDVLPSWLREVRPYPGSRLTQDEYQSVITPEIVYEGPPPPSVEVTGWRSSICFDLDVESLVEPGDFLFWDKDVDKRVKLIVNGSVLEEKADTEYLAVIEPGPMCKCFPDCEGDKRNFDSYDPPEYAGCWFWPGFWHCYQTDLELGDHIATVEFETTSKGIVSFQWQFTITE